MANKINSKMIVGYVVAGAALVFLIFIGFIDNRGQKEDFFAVDIENNNTVYQTKLEAYKAKQKEGSRTSLSTRPSTYESEAISLSEYEEQQIGTAPPEAAAQQGTTTELRQEQTQQRSTPRRTTSPAEEEAKKITDNIRREISGESEALNQQTSQTNAAQSEADKEKRKQQLEQSWGAVGASNAAANGTKDGYTAYIHGTQKIKQGQAATFRTADEIKIGERVIPKNTLVSGIITINQSRLNVNIRSIRINREIIQTNFAVYGSDGIKGLPLDFDAVSNSAGDQISNEVVNQTTQVMRGTGVIGRSIGGITTAIANASSRDKNADITLIDSQMVILKIE